MLRAHLTYKPRGIWVLLHERLIDDNGIEELLLILKAITQPDLLPLCFSIDWAAEMVASFLENEK